MKNNLKQTIILNLALQEADIDPNSCEIVIDHDKGFSYVNDVKLPVIFPKQWFENTSKLHSNKKEYKFYFNGHIGERSSRKELMKSFLDREDCKIVWSNDGRDVKSKDKYNVDYFSGLSKSKYGLCPHQVDWPGNKDFLWTYRYIECLMSKVIPVIFRKTPLSDTFINDSYFVWDDDILKTEIEHDQEHLDYNYNFALSKFTLNETQIRTIKKSSKNV